MAANDAGPRYDGYSTPSAPPWTCPRIASVRTVDQLVAELAELIAIPSVSADPAHQDGRCRSGRLGCRTLRAAGGERRGDPVGRAAARVGEVQASANPDEAPTILCYGHFDVQPPDPLELWESPPFELVERDGWLYARGIADDKGQLYMLLKAAELLAAAGELPVNLRIACDGEEEIGGHSIVDWIAQDERGADAAIVFDSGMVEQRVPAFNIAVRGRLLLPRQGSHRRARSALRHVRRRLAERDARAHADAGRRAPAQRPPARAAARRDRVAVRLRARRLERSCPPGPPRSPPRARGRRMLRPRRSSTCAPGPSRPST